jgi:hypothetical protein
VFKGSAAPSLHPDRKKNLDRCIADRVRLAREPTPWERPSNDSGATIRWMFNVEMARTNSLTTIQTYPKLISPIVRTA